VRRRRCVLRPPVFFFLLDKSFDLKLGKIIFGVYLCFNFACAKRLFALSDIVAAGK